jgi:membrane protein DedA with SNARE-associated domain
MDQYLANAEAFLTAQQAWAGPIAGAVILVESLAVVGLAVPATALMVAIGGLVGAGTLAPVPVLLWCIVGAVVGDAISYVIGRALGPQVCRRWPLNRHRSAVERTRLFFRRYGIASIFFGRFLGPIRSTVPLVAGIMLMSQRRFQAANVASALVWVPAMLAPGYLAAKGFADVGGLDTDMLLLGLGAVVVATMVGPWLAVRLMARGGGRRRRRALVARANRGGGADSGPVRE